MAADAELRGAVDIKHAHLHGLLAAGFAIGGCKGEVERLVSCGSVVNYVLCGCPLQVAGYSIKNEAFGGVGVVVER